MTSLKDRTISDLKAVCGDLVESLCATFPESTELKEWCDALVNGFDSEGKGLVEFLSRITTFLTTTVPHKMVKYDRAILSITGNPLNVYQVLMYKDIATVTEVFPRLKSLHLYEKIKSLSVDDLGMFWQFVHEGIQLVLRATQTIPPIVPTTEQIAEDIERRRRQRDQMTNDNDTCKSTMSVADGVEDLWKELCQTRNVEPTPLTDALSERVARLVTKETSEGDMCRNFPELGDDEYSDESLTIARRIGNLCTMKNAIPTNMMSGIERVASSLVRDINNGKMDFASLDVEKIGEQVLQGLGEGDVNDFANSLDKILPALQSMGGGKM
tara:strand:+ start:1818 stop:2798 length:981 start_codon:yes stop_codon:yes gene_type:complete